MAPPSPVPSPAPPAVTASSSAAAADDPFGETCAELDVPNSSEDAAAPTPSVGPITPADDASTALRELASPMAAEDHTRVEPPVTSGSEDASILGRFTTPATSPADDVQAISRDVALQLTVERMTPEPHAQLVTSMSSQGATLPGSASSSLDAPSETHTYVAVAPSRHSSLAREADVQADSGSAQAVPQQPAGQQGSTYDSSSSGSVDDGHLDIPTLDVNASADASPEARCAFDQEAALEVRTQRLCIGHPMVTKCVECAGHTCYDVQEVGKLGASCEQGHMACSHEALVCQSHVQGEFGEEHDGDALEAASSSAARGDLPSTDSEPRTTPTGEAALPPPREGGTGTHSNPSQDSATGAPTMVDQQPAIQLVIQRPAEGPTSLQQLDRPGADTIWRKRPTLHDEPAPSILDQRVAPLPPKRALFQASHTLDSIPRKRRRVQPEPDSRDGMPSGQDVDTPAFESPSPHPAESDPTTTRLPAPSQVPEGDMAYGSAALESQGLPSPGQSVDDSPSPNVVQVAVAAAASRTLRDAAVAAADTLSPRLALERFPFPSPQVPLASVTPPGFPGPSVVAFWAGAVLSPTTASIAEGSAPAEMEEAQTPVSTRASTQPELPDPTPQLRCSKRKRTGAPTEDAPVHRPTKRVRAARKPTTEKPRERLIIRIPARSRPQTSAEEAPVTDAAVAPVIHPYAIPAATHPPAPPAGIIPIPRVDAVELVEQGGGGEAVEVAPLPDDTPSVRIRRWINGTGSRSVPNPPPRPPLPADCRPHLWAQTRQEICESVPWFRTYQAGVYSKDNVVYGYMLGGCAAPRDVFAQDGRIIISHIGGGQETVDDDGDDDTGQPANPDAPPAKGPGRGRKTRLRESQGESLPGHRAALTSAWMNQHPVVVLADRHYARFPYELASDGVYYTLGFYWIRDMWEEAEPGKRPTECHTRVKVCLQWVDSQGEPWWWPRKISGDDLSSHSSAPALGQPDATPRPRPRKVFSIQIKALYVGPPSQRDYLDLANANSSSSTAEQHTQCGHCGSGSKRIYTRGWMCLNARCDSFWVLEDGTSPRGEGFDIDPAFLALVETPPHIAAVIRKSDYRPQLPDVGDEDSFLATSRAFYQGFLCERCGRVSTRSNWERWECPGCPNSFDIKWPVHRSSAWQAALGVPPGGQFKIHDQSVRLQQGSIRVDDSGTTARVNQFLLPHDRGSIFQIIGNDATNSTADLILERYQRDFADPKRPLFKRMPLASHTLSTPLLTQYYSQNSGVPYKYIAKADATIPFSEAPRSVNMALDLITLRARLVAPGAEFNELLTAGYLEGQMMNFRSDKEKGLGRDVAALSLGSPALMKFRYNTDRVHRRVLEFTLNHGDILVMHGTGIQECYEHTVIPTGFRIAATARLIDWRNALEPSAMARKPMQIGPTETVEIAPPPDLSGMMLIGPGDEPLVEGGALAGTTLDAYEVEPIDQAPTVQGAEESDLEPAFSRMQIDFLCN
ncbi:hypothetical protein AURDEDRAFT_183651 [Auricularia subglabra TFB-10046 SS5]|nr:hypothetical protein AURDEDRAFT_183651 [Auricularia subglabra TFB-10046 SS5]